VPLKILLAGVSKDERERIEGLVRGVVGKRATSGSFVVSLVKVGGRWSATLDGPGGLNGVTFAAAEEGLADALRQALGDSPAPASTASTGGRPAPSPTPVSSAGRSLAGPPQARGEKQERLNCSQCERPFVVFYESDPGEGLETVAVACPHCWHKNAVMIGYYAATGRDYRAEKAD
jgi:hypothetical protein